MGIGVLRPHLVVLTVWAPDWLEARPRDRRTDDQVPLRELCFCECPWAKLFLILASLSVLLPSVIMQKA